MISYSYNNKKKKASLPKVAVIAAAKAMEANPKLRNLKNPQLH